MEEAQKPEIYFKPPRRHLDILKCSLDNFIPGDAIQRKTLEFAKKLTATSSPGLYLHGGTGRGKTHLLVGCARMLKENGVSVSYVSGSGEELWTLVSGNIPWQTKGNDTNPLLQSDVLIIDDLTIEPRNGHQSVQLYQLILRLYDRGELVLISSNHSPEGLVGRLSVIQGQNVVQGQCDAHILNEYGSDAKMQARTLDRLREMCLFVDLSSSPNAREKMQERYIEEYLKPDKESS